MKKLLDELEEGLKRKIEEDYYKEHWGTMHPKHLELELKASRHKIVEHLVKVGTKR